MEKTVIWKWISISVDMSDIILQSDICCTVTNTVIIGGGVQTCRDYTDYFCEDKVEGRNRPTEEESEKIIIIIYLIIDLLLSIWHYEIMKNGRHTVF